MKTIVGNIAVLCFFSSPNKVEIVMRDGLKCEARLHHTGEVNVGDYVCKWAINSKKKTLWRIDSVTPLEEACWYHVTMKDTIALTGGKVLPRLERAIRAAEKNVNLNRARSG